MDVTVPTRIVSEDPSGPKLRFYPSRFPADYPILVDFYSDLLDQSTRGSQGVPAYRVVHSMGSTDDFPIKAPTRQMLYPLSYRGIYAMAPAC